MNKTVQDLSGDFKSKNDEINTIKSQNKYIQSSLTELRSFIEKAKNLEDLKQKDVSFKAFFANLEEIKAEATELQQTSENNMQSVSDLLEEANFSLKSSNLDLESLNVKVDSLKDLYVNHDETYQELRQKCNQADIRASNVTKLSNKWSQEVIGILLLFFLILF